MFSMMCNVVHVVAAVAAAIAVAILTDKTLAVGCLIGNVQVMTRIVTSALYHFEYSHIVNLCLVVNIGF